MATAKRNRKLTDFTDQTVTGGVKERPRTLSFKAGQQEIIRVITPPATYFGGNVNYANSDKGFFAISLAEIEDCHQMHDDPKAMARAKKACPLVAAGIELKQRWAVLVYWVGTLRRGKFQKRGEFIPWAFGGDKYVAIRNVLNSLPRSKSDPTKPRPLHLVELIVDCTEEKYQRVTINAVTDKSTMRSSWADVKAEIEAQGVLSDSDDLSSDCALIDELLEPESKQSLTKSIARAMAGDEESDEFDGAPARGKPARGKPTRGKPQDEDEELAEELDAAMEDDDEDDGLGDPDDDEDEDKPARTKSGKKSGKKSKPSDDEDVADDDDEDDRPKGRTRSKKPKLSDEDEDDGLGTDDDTGDEDD